MTTINQVELLAKALAIHAGEADIADLYITYGTLRVASGEGLPREWHASVRSALQTSPRFVRVERGRFRLRRSRNEQ
jgi:hypothetical protein